MPPFQSPPLDACLPLLPDTPAPDCPEPASGSDAFAQVPARAAAGDLWYLGRHRLLVGDCMEAANLARLLDGRMPQMVFADPPYGIAIVKGKSVGGSKPFGKGQVAPGPPRFFGGRVGASKAIAAGVYPPVLGDENPDLAKAAWALYTRRWPKAAHIWWGANHYAAPLPDSPCWIVWDKERTGHFADGELAWTNLKGAVRIFHHKWNGMIKASERGEKRLHPTQKPIALAEWVYQRFGKEWDLVLDPFAGSGPALLAAELTNRTCYCFEAMPLYADRILARWERLTRIAPARLP